MGKFVKPPVYNPVKAEERISALSQEVEELRSEVDKLKKDKTNLEIRCRILEERLGQYENRTN